MRRFLKENSLSIFFGVLFLAALVGQEIAGWHQFNDQQLAEGVREDGAPLGPPGSSAARRSDQR